MSEIGTSTSKTAAPQADERARPREGMRTALVALAALAAGYALGLKSARTHAPPPVEVEAATVASTTSEIEPALVPEASFPPPGRPSRESTETAQPSSTSAAAIARADAEALGRIASLDAELARLARALSTPRDYRAPGAVLDDLAGYDSARSRRDALARSLSEEKRAELAPPAEPSEGLLARRREIEKQGAFGLVVRAVPEGMSYVPVPAPSPEGRGAESDLFLGVALGGDGSGPRIAFRTQRGDAERRVTITEDAAIGQDVLKVEYAEREGPVRLVRRSRLGPAGETWRALSERLWSTGSIEHEELERLVGRPLERPPRPGWIDWLRRHLDLPRNRDLGEEYGPPPPLARTNPLLLADARSRPAVLDRGDLVVDPERPDPPVILNGRGPFFLIAANAVGVYDAAAWRWLVFDAATRRVVDHAELPGSEVRHIRWDFLPELERFPTKRRGDLTEALLATAIERTRQAIQLVTLPEETSQLARELRSKIGGVLTADGLDALRLRNEILDRMKRLNWLGHLLLDEDGANYCERALDHAKLETTSEVVDVIARMIEEGHEGPAEYLMRDDRLKQMLYHPPCEKTDRERLRKLFREKFRPWSERTKRAFTGAQSYWYEAEEGG